MYINTFLVVARKFSSGNGANMSNVCTSMVCLWRVVEVVSNGLHSTKNEFWIRYFISTAPVRVGTVMYSMAFGD